MYINIGVYWTINKMGCINSNNMTIIKSGKRVLNDMVHIAHYSILFIYVLNKKICMQITIIIIIIIFI